ncbi:MAG: hypothetical protein AB7U05_13430 [Mangrovibacterium sp.]
MTIVLSLLLLSVQAQQELNYTEVNHHSYELLSQGKWKELINYSEEARQQGIDFFYLQARTGIAYYNLEKYRLASGWFLKAWKRDQSFDWLQEYLYYSLLFGGRATEASQTAGSFFPEMKEKIGYVSNQLTRVGIEAGYSFNPRFDASTASPHGQQVGVGENYGEAFYLKDYHFESFDLSHRISPGFYMNHNLQYISQSQEQHADWGVGYNYPIKISQLQYFLNPHFILGKKLYVSPSFTLIWGNYDLIMGDYEPMSFYLSTNKYADFVFSTATWFHWGNFSPGAEINLAGINDENFTQLSAWLTVYPLSNLNFYFTPRIYLKGNTNNELTYNTFGISGGLQLGPVHFYGSYQNGRMENFIEYAGYLVYNFPGSTKQKFSGSIFFPAGKKYQFALRYVLQDMTETYWVYTDMIRTNSVNYTYTKHTLTAGIAWNF